METFEIKVSKRTYKRLENLLTELKSKNATRKNGDIVQTVDDAANYLIEHVCTDELLERMELESLIRKKCEENEFVRSRNSYYAQGDPLVDGGSDYRLNFSYFTDLQKLKKAFIECGMLREVYIYKDLVFVNALIDGWEAWTLKRFGDKLISFESISMGRVAKTGISGKTFEQYIEELAALTEEQVKNYMKG
jgi:hypothetical protein